MSAASYMQFCSAKNYREGATTMITGEMKSKVDAVWDAFWAGGISNPLEVMEQIT